MDPITPWVTGLGALGGLFGGGGDEPGERLAKSMGYQHEYWAPQVTTALWRLFQQPEQDPWWRTQMSQAESDIGAYYDQAVGEALMDYQRYGLGRPGESGAANRMLMLMGGQRARDLARMRTGQMGEMYGRRMGALGSLGGFIGAGAGPALSYMGGQAGRGWERERETGGALGDLMRLWALRGYQPQGPPTGGGQQSYAPSGYGGYGGSFWPPVTLTALG